MRNFTNNSDQLNELVDFIKTTINQPHADRTDASFRVCVEYRDDDILVYPADDTTMMLVDRIMEKVSDLKLNAILDLKYRRDMYIPTLMIY